MRATDKILIVMIVYLVLFSAGVLVIFWHTGEEPTVLVGGTVAALVTEIIALCRIRINKEQTDDEQQQTGELHETEPESLGETEPQDRHGQHTLHGGESER